MNIYRWWLVGWLVMGCTRPTPLPAPATTLPASVTAVRQATPTRTQTAQATTRPNTLTPTWTASATTRPNTLTPMWTASATTRPNTLTPTPLASPTPCGETWFFAPAHAPATCPGQAAVWAETVAQPFEHGLMLWRAVPGPYGSAIYAFFYDGRWPQWNPTLDAWRPGQPEFDPALQPPPGLFQPVRGFGLFWRTSTIPQDDALVTVRERLGWATAPEFSLGAQPMQCHDPNSYTGGCFLAGPAGAVYRVDEGNIWALVVPPTR